MDGPVGTDCAAVSYGGSCAPCRPHHLWRERTTRWLSVSGVEQRTNGTRKRAAFVTGSCSGLRSLRVCCARPPAAWLERIHELLALSPPFDCEWLHRESNGIGPKTERTQRGWEVCLVLEALNLTACLSKQFLHNNNVQPAIELSADLFHNSHAFKTELFMQAQTRIVAAYHKRQHRVKARLTGN